MRLAMMVGMNHGARARLHARAIEDAEDEHAGRGGPTRAKTLGTWTGDHRSRGSEVEVDVAARGVQVEREHERTKPPIRAWIGVACRAHVRWGVAGGFAQLCHGRSAPLRKMAVGDWLVYYSPTTELGPNAATLRSFTALGRVVGDGIYSFDMGNGFVPYRRDVLYTPLARDVPVSELASQLEFVRKSRNWGMLARRGHFEIGLGDVEHITHAALRPRTVPSPSAGDAGKSVVSIR